jgi:serine/threonine protein kinase
MTTADDHCLTPDEAVDHVAGRSDAARAARIEEHIDRCPSCRRYLSELARVTPPPGASTAGADADGRVGRYVVRHPIGEGGMGVVYAAHDPDLGREVALKLLHPTVAAERLIREAQALARLSHPNVVTVYEVGEDRGRVFLAMERVRGITLRAWLAEPRPWRAIVAAFLEAGRGLEAAHQAGLVHRDFKPANVLRGDDGRVRVVDFGLALPLATGAGAGAAAPLRCTQTGARLGTPAYMAPEQHRGDQATARSDQYAFAVALWEALHGEHPFGGESWDELADRAGAGRLRPPRRRLPAPLQRGLERALRADAAERFPTITDLLALLEASRAPRRLWAMAVVLLLLTAAGAGGWLLARGASVPAPQAIPPPVPAPQAIPPPVPGPQAIPPPVPVAGPSIDLLAYVPVAKAQLLGKLDHPYLTSFSAVVRRDGMVSFHPGGSVMYAFSAAAGKPCAGVVLVTADHVEVRTQDFNCGGTELRPRCSVDQVWQRADMHAERVGIALYQNTGAATWWIGELGHLSVQIPDDCGAPPVDAGRF